MKTVAISVPVLRLTRTAFLFCAVNGAMVAQTPAPAPPPPGLPIVNSQGLEVELVEAHKLIGIPAQIMRNAGSFILVIANKSPDPTAWFVVDAAPAASAAATESAAGGVAAAPVASVVTTLTHLLVIGSGQFEPKHRSGAVFAAAPGTYQLKYGVSGAVLCTIVIQ